MSRILMLLAALSLSMTARAEPVKKSVVIAVFTGPEDAQKLSAAFRHALAMKKTGALGAVSMVVYGRAIAAVSTEGKDVPEKVRGEIRDALAGGVSIFACEQALATAKLPRASLLPGVVPVPQGSVKLAELIAGGSVPLQY